MSKLLMRYIGEDDYVTGLKQGQQVEVYLHSDDEGIYYTCINKYNEEIYLTPDEVVHYE